MPRPAAAGASSTSGRPAGPRATGPRSRNGGSAPLGIRSGRMTATTDPAAVWKEEVRGGYPDPRLLALPGRRRLECWRRNIMPPPPLAHLTGAMPSGFGTGTAEARMPTSPWLAASNGLLTGGSLAILADIAFGISVETELPAATPYTTAELSLSFLRPARPNGSLSAGGQAIHVGRSIGLSEAFVIDEETDRLIAHGTSRLTIFPPLDPAPEPPETVDRHVAPAYDSPDPYLRPPPGGIIPQEIWAELPGAEILRRQLSGDLPPPPPSRCRPPRRGASPRGRSGRRGPGGSSCGASYRAISPPRLFTTSPASV